MNTLIFDPAHGKDVKGKRSPDGRHEEWLWSRNCIRSVMYDVLETNDLTFNVHAPYLSYTNEPGLTTRVRKYNELTEDNTLMLSIHNDASPLYICDKDGWGEPNGIAFWTSKGETKADKWVDFMIERFEVMMPNEHFRKAFWLGEGEKVKDADYEANFTVLAGNSVVKPKYEGILMEVLFQNNRKDVEKLLSWDWNLLFNTTLHLVLIDLFDNIDKL